MVSVLFNSTPSLEQAITHLPLMIPSDTPLAEAIARMIETHTTCLIPQENVVAAASDSARACASCVLVVDDRQLLGIFTERDLVRLRAEGQSLSGKTIAEVMTHPVIRVSTADLNDLFAILNLFHRHRIRHLPIVDDTDRVIGLLTHERLQQLLRPIDLLRLRLVAEVMVREVVCATPETPVLELAQRMAQHHVSSVVIVRPMEPSSPYAETPGMSDRPCPQLPVGLVTERDIVQFHALELDFATVQAQRVMSRPVFTVHADDSLWAARDLMAEKRVGRAVVTGDRGELLGIITRTTLLQTLNPIEMYKLVGVLEQKVCRLEADKLELLRNRTTELEHQVQERTLELKKQAEREHLLTEIATRIRASLNLHDTLQAVVTETRRFLACDRVLIYQFHPDWSGQVTAEDVLPAWSAALGNTITDCCFQDKAQKLYAQGRKQAVADIDDAGYPDCYIQMLAHYQVRANLTVPILVDNQLWGLLIGHQCGQSRNWQAAELELLDKIAIQVAIAIQQAIAFEQSQAELRERQRAEEFLEKAALRTRMLLDTSFDGIVVIDQQGYVVETNARFAAMLGYSPDALIGTNVTDWDVQLTPEEIQAMLDNVHQQVAQPPDQGFSEPPHLFETRHRRRDGSTYDVEISYSSAIWEGQPFHFCVCRDITDRKQVEKALLQLNQKLETHIEQRTLELQQSEARFRQTFEQSPLGIIISDLQGQINQVNSSLKQVLKYSTAELLQLSVPDLIPPPMRQHYEEQLQQLSQQSLSVMSHEVLLTAKQGEPVWVTMTSALIFDTFGHPSDVIHLIEDISDRKQSEAEFRLLSERLELALRSASIGTWEWNVRLDRLIWDERMYQLYQWEADKQSITYQTWVEHIHPEDRPRLEGRIRQAVQQEREFEAEFRIVLPDGSVRFIKDYATLQRDDQGQVERVVGINFDITERNQAEARLRESEQRFRQLAENTDDIFWIRAITGEMLYISPGYETIWQRSVEELYQNPAIWLESIHPDDYEAVKLTAYHNLASFDQEYRIVRPDGQTRWIHDRGFAIRDPQGEIYRFAGIAEDISDRKTANDALARQLAAIEAAIDGIAILEGDAYTYLNKAHLELFGYHQPEDLLGKSWTTLYADTELQRIQREVFPLLVQNNHWQGEAIATRKDGSTFIEGLSLTLTGNGELICVCRDITAQRQAEDQVQQTNQQLILSNAELARASRLRDEFLANMSHELRTPLNAILGMAEGLQEKTFGALSSDQERAIATIERGGRHLLELINDILDLSKIESGKLELQMAPISVTYLCESSLTFIRQQAIKKNIRLSADVPSGLPDMSVDDRRVRQILINLLSNAVKFTPDEGDVKLVVSTEIQDDSCFILFSVHDTGIGIAPENLSKLFQPFMQIDSSFTRQHAGTGLGLALVRQLAELHQGTVTVESTVGQGSCFTLRLPYVQVAQSAPSPSSNPQPLPLVSPRASTSTTVLIIEDDPVAVEHLTRYLTEVNLKAIACRQGQGALEKAAQIQPALIILDLLLPDMSGWGLLRQLKSHPRTRTIPVLITSVMDERSRGIAQGALNYLVKPVTREQFYDVLHSIQLPPQSPASATIATIPKSIPASLPSLAPALVLLVEDNPANVATLSGYLKNRGFRMLLAEDGVEAVTLTQTHRPDLILMDIQMPNMNGLDAIRQIRTNGAIAHIPIIALTALAMPQDREKCMEAGADDYISKPVRLKYLVEVMQRLLDNRNSG